MCAPIYTWYFLTNQWITNFPNKLPFILYRKTLLQNYMKYLGVILSVL